LVFSTALASRAYSVTLQLSTFTVSAGSAFGSCTFVSATPSISNAFSASTAETVWGLTAGSDSLPLSFSNLSGYSCYGTTQSIINGTGASPVLWLVANSTAATSIVFYFAITAVPQ
jgi:hypothetical protein